MCPCLMVQYNRDIIFFQNQLDCLYRKYRRYYETIYIITHNIVYSNHVRFVIRIGDIADFYSLLCNVICRAILLYNKNDTAHVL